jgi:hypothetical protein
LLEEIDCIISDTCAAQFLDGKGGLGLNESIEKSRVVPRKESRPGQGLVQYATERPHIDSICILLDIITPYLWGEIAESTDYRPKSSFVIDYSFGNAKVADFNPPEWATPNNKNILEAELQKLAFSVTYGFDSHPT